MKSNSEMVKDFTEETSDSVKYFKKDEILFLFQMCFSELIELLQTEYTKDEIYDIVLKNVDKDFSENYIIPNNPAEKLADQADACVDCWYYALNAFCK